jgi:acetylornithine deacetylase/succinyl-diaminopimelate desuccinylase-like protein
MRKWIVSCFALAMHLAAYAYAQPVREWRAAHEREILEEYAQLLRLPNIAQNLQDMRRNADLIREMYERRGIQLQLLEVPDAPPAIFGEWRTPGATRTVVFYAHYDGQPVIPSEWVNKAPFDPELRDAAGRLLSWQTPAPFNPEWRIHARSASDDKAPIIAFLAAVDAMKAAGIRPTVNIKFFFDGEEERGSPHLAEILTKYKDLLSSDGWIFCDGPMHQSRRPSIVFGNRGNMTLEVTAYGPRVELHSGHYGNWAPNPALALAQLLASMKDENGRVLIPGFYDDVLPLTIAEQLALKEEPNIDDELKRQFALGSTEVPTRSLAESITLPALNIQGLSSAGVAQDARNVIPATATAMLGVRLVKAMDPKKTVDQVIAHIRSNGFFVTTQPADDETRRTHPKIAYVRQLPGANPAVRTPLDSPFARRIREAIERTHGPVIQVLTLGGTVPTDAIERVLAVPIMTVPIVNHDNNQHSHNENIRLKNLWDGIETMAALMTMQF